MAQKVFKADLSVNGIEALIKKQTMWFSDFFVETQNLLNYAKGILGEVEK